MNDDCRTPDSDGLGWLGSREELDAWKRYKQSKALAFVERGYSVSWYPDADHWMEIYSPERHHVEAPEIRAAVKFYGQPSAYGIDGGMVSKLGIVETRTDLVRLLLGQPSERVRVLYNYDRGPDINHLHVSPAAHRLYGVILEELN